MRPGGRLPLPGNLAQLFALRPFTGFQTKLNYPFYEAEARFSTAALLPKQIAGKSPCRP